MAPIASIARPLDLSPACLIGLRPAILEGLALDEMTFFKSAGR